ncbi:hypothetical protein NI35_2076 [Salmonella enterica subsp. enterica serovar Cerro]|nr:hypothetical protein GW13_PRO1091 [Salmonella enterica subsp. enterica serovar Cerro]KMN26188.1 hypothetical protein NI35_2076 [Salmonella enterica subsp. enterica serovar Cerro]
MTWLLFSSSFRPQHAYQQVSLLSDCFALCHLQAILDSLHQSARLLPAFSHKIARGFVS